MGSELRRQLREALGPDIKGLQRAVALEIADDARWDDGWNFDPVRGRRSKARLADLVRWTAAKDELSVREMLRRLSVAGWEFRLPIGKGKDGRLLYAVPGVAMQFRVPDFEAPTTVGPMDSEDPTTVGPMGTQGPTVVGEGPTTVGEGPTVVAEGPTVVGPLSPSSPSSPKESPSSSLVAEDSRQGTDAATTEGGGGGVDDSYTQLASEFVDALDYRGKLPSKKQREKLTSRTAAALAAGWPAEALASHLDLGGAAVNSAVAVYLHRLADDELPNPPAAAAPPLPPACEKCLHEYPAAQYNVRFRRQNGQPCPDCHPGGIDPWGHGADERNELTGTDARVAGWLALAGQLPGEEPIAGGRGGRQRARSHTPYNGEVWRQLDAQAARGGRPAGYERVPYCGDSDCDEITRTREIEDDNGLRVLTPCAACHPMLQFR